jgi:hypothetical protein
MSSSEGLINFVKAVQKRIFEKTRDSNPIFVYGTDHGNGLIVLTLFANKIPFMFLEFKGFESFKMVKLVSNGKTLTHDISDIQLEIKVNDDEFIKNFCSFTVRHIRDFIVVCKEKGVFGNKSENEWVESFDISKMHCS